MKLPWLVNSLTVIIVGVAVWMEISLETRAAAAHSSHGQRSSLSSPSEGIVDLSDPEEVRSGAARKDFRARAAEIQEMIGIRRSHAIKELAKDWVKHDAGAALRWANTLRKGPERAEVIADMLNRPEDAVALSQVIEEERINLSEIGQYSQNFYWQFSIALAREIGEAEAYAWFDRNMKGGGMNFVLEAIVWDVSSRDLQAAMSLLKLSDVERIWQDAASRILGRTDIDDQDRVDAFFELSDGNFSRSFTSRILYQWKFESTEGSDTFRLAINRIQANRHVPEFNEMASIAAMTMGACGIGGYDDQVESLEFLGDSGKLDFPDVYASIYRNWMFSSGKLPSLDGENDTPLEIPDELVSYANQKNELPDVGMVIFHMEEDFRKNEVVRSFVQKWLSIAPAECGEWVASLPVGDVRDTAIEGIVRDLLPDDRNSAAEWANKIDNLPIREKVMETIIHLK